MERTMRANLCALGLMTIVTLTHTASGATLVARYTFSNAGSLGLDSSGNGNNAIVRGLVTQGTGPGSLNSAVFSRNGVIEYFSNLVYGGSITFTPAAGFSYSTWFNLADTNTFNGLISQD